MFIEILLAVLTRGVEDLEVSTEVQAEVGTVWPSVVFDVKPKRVRLAEQAGVLGKHAKEQPHHEAFDVVLRVSAVFQGVVERREPPGGVDVGGILGVEDLRAVASDEREGANVVVEILKGELNGSVVIEIVKGDAGEVGDDDVLRNLLLAVVADECADVAHGL